MSQFFKENAHLKTNLEKYSENWEMINWGSSSSRASDNNLNPPDANCVIYPKDDGASPSSPVLSDDEPCFLNDLWEMHERLTRSDEMQKGCIKKHGDDNAV